MGSCANDRCVASDKICNLVDDCGDSSDETVGGVCFGYIGCDFENNSHRFVDTNIDPCNFTQDNSDNFDWTLNYGWTPSYNTGPTRDHTRGTYEGKLLIYQPY